MLWDLNEEFLNVHGKLLKITDVYWGSSTTYKDLDRVLQQQLVDTTLLFKAMALCWEKGPWLFLS